MDSQDKGITLHPKYGLNPTLATCFYCGKETGEIALLGVSYPTEAPKNMVINLEPCDECKEKYKDYTLLIEATRKLKPRSRKYEPVPTGRWAAVKRELFSVAPTPLMYADTATMDYILRLAKEVEEARNAG